MKETLQLLNHFFEHPGRWFYARELALALGHAERQTYNRLKLLVETGYLQKEKTLYRTSPAFVHRFTTRARAAALHPEGF